MTDGIDRTDRTFCSVFELLVTAYHEGGHAVGALLVSPALPLEYATIVPRDHDNGHVSIEDWTDLLIPDIDDDDCDGPCEHERMYLEAETLMTFLGGLVEGRFRSGDLTTWVPAGFAFDGACIIETGERLCADELGTGPFAAHGYGRAWMQSMCSRAIALTERQPHFWHAVGLVAAALMREKTLSGADVEALVKAAHGRA